MAGVKGKSGGPRPNSGGARPGSGRPAVEMPVPDVPVGEDPMTFLLSIMNDPSAEGRVRLDAAKALLPFMHQKKGEGGKKSDAADKAKKAAGGRFAASPPPLKLVSR